MLRTEEDTKPIALDAVIRDEIESTRAAFPEATVNVDGTLPEVEVRADDMLSSVVENLLSNAIHHNDKSEPEVTVSVTERANDVVVAVADNGPGVPDEHKDQIFGKGEKGLESDGTGIGLYLVNTLVDEYGGTVWVTDNDPRGAVFTFTLPLVS